MLNTTQNNFSETRITLANSVFALPVKTPFNFMHYYDLMLRGHCVPIPYLFSLSDWKCAIRLHNGTIVPTLVACSATSSSLDVGCFCDLSTDEERELGRILGHIFCTKLDLQAFYQRASMDDALSKTIKRLNGLKPFLTFDPFASLIKAVMRQLVSAQAARSSISLLVRRLGIKITVQNEDFYGFPSAETLAMASKKELIECKVGYKWKLIKEISKAVTSNEFHIDELEGLSDDAIIEFLTNIKGIGYWTSRIFLYDGLGRINSYPTHDISLKKAVSMLYYNDDEVTWDEVDNFFLNYREFTGVASHYLFGALWLRKLDSA